MARRDQAAEDLQALLSQFEQQREVTHRDMGTTLQQREAAITRRIPLDRLVPDPNQPRKTFPEEDLQRLAESLAQHGQIQPILVRPAQGKGRRGMYEIVAGERRFRAAQLAGIADLEAKVESYELNTAAVVQLVENLHREDLSDIDKAHGLQRLRQLTEKTWEEVAELVRLSQAYVKKLAGLVKLEEPVQELIREGKLSGSQGSALLRYPGQLQVVKAQEVVDKGIPASVIQRESQRELPPARRGPKPRAAGPPVKPSWLSQLETDLESKARQAEAPPIESPTEETAATPTLSSADQPVLQPERESPAEQSSEPEVDLKLLAALGKQSVEAYFSEEVPPAPTPRPAQEVKADNALGVEDPLSVRLVQLGEYCRYLDNWLQNPKVKGRQYDAEALSQAIGAVRDLQDTLRRLKRHEL